MVVGTAAAGLLATGVSVSELVRFALFEAAFTLLPGFVVYRALSPRAGSALRQIVLSGALGSVVQVLAFAAAAAAGVRWAFYLLPAVAVAAAVPLGIRPPRWGGGRFSHVDVATAGVLCAALVLVTVGYFLDLPYPASAGGHQYDHTELFAQSIAGEALHHWPVEDPFVAGLRLEYHKFAFMRMAAIAQGTGIDLTTAALRLWIVPTVLLVALASAWGGRRATGTAAAAPVAAALVVLTGEIDLSPVNDLLTLGSPLEGWFAPHFVAFAWAIPLIVVLWELLAVREAAGFGPWAIAALLVVGVGGAKGINALPVVAGGITLLAVARFVLERRVDVRAIVAAAAIGAYTRILIDVQYGGTTRGSRIELLQALEFTEVTRAFGFPGVEGLERALLVPVATLALLLGTLGILLVGMVARFALVRRPLDYGGAFLLAVFLASLIPPLLLYHQGGAA